MGPSNEGGSVHESTSEQAAKPAVGTVVTGDNEADVARLVLRASHQGFPVVLTYDGLRPDRLEFLRQDGVVLVHPNDRSPTKGELIALLARTTSERGYPGLIYHDDPGQPIDYTGSASVFEGDGGFVVESETRSTPTDGTCEVLVAIPAYNEHDTIDEVVSTAVEHADEVLVVDDGSDDDTAERAAESGADVVAHPENRGYGAALKTAFEEADRRSAARVVTLDGDGQHDPADVPRAVEALEDGDADVVIGSRFDGVESDVPRYRRVGIGVINALTNLGLGTVGRGSWIADTQSGFRAYDREVVRTLARDGDVGEGMSASTDILYHLRRMGYDVDSVGIEVDYDVENGSSQHPLTHGLSIVASILRRSERERPLGVIGVPGVVMSAGGLGLGYWTLADFARTGTLSLGGTLSATLLVLVGLFACFVSVVLHALNVRLWRLADSQTERLGKIQRQ